MMPRLSTVRWIALCTVSVFAAFAFAVPSQAALIAAGGNVAATDQIFTQVNFTGTFEEAPVIVALGGDDGGTGNPSGVRIRNVTATGFEVAHLKPDDTAGNNSTDGTTSATNIHWFALAPGQHTIDGVKFEAIKHQTTTARGSSGAGKFNSSGGFDTVNYGAGSFFSGSTVGVLSSVNSMANETYVSPAFSSPWLQTVVDTDSATETSVSIALERAEVNDGTSNDIDERITSLETIGIIVAEDGTGSFSPDLGSDILFETIFDDNAVGGPEDTVTPTAFTQAFSSAPLVAGSQMSVRGTDGGWLRRTGVTASQFTGVSQEDRFSDSEVGHAIEDIALIAFSDQFELSVVPEPSTYLLAVVGMIGIGLLRRWRPRRA